MVKIKIYCGESIQDLIPDRRYKDMHPITAVNLVKLILSSNNDYEMYTNDCILIQAFEHFSKEYPNTQVEFFLNNVSQGNDISEIFKDFNRALDAMEIY